MIQNPKRAMFPFNIQIVWCDEDFVYVASVLELPEFTASGKTISQAAKAIEGVLEQHFNTIETPHLESKAKSEGEKKW